MTRAFYILRSAVLLLPLLAFTLPTNAQAKQFVLKVMTYNVKGVPVFWYWHFRHKYIGRELKKLRESGQGAHIVALQEMMSRRTKKIHKIAGYPHRSKGPKGKGFRVNGGLEVLSEFPIIHQAKRVYKKCKGWDCISRKGVHLSRVLIPGLPFPIDFYNTHLQADGKHRDTRMTQVVEMNDFINKTRDHKFPMIAVGDFNFRQGQREYKSFEDTHVTYNAAKECGTVLNCEGEIDPYEVWLSELIDHQFFHIGSNGQVTITPIYYEHMFTDKIVGRTIKQPLSDHPAVMVHYLIQY